MLSPIPCTSIETWFLQSARRLPWRDNRTPYTVWLSEIMLQQTQVTVVIDYFHRFLERFPTVEALANAPLDDALALWSGLGYYSRCRNLHKTAQIITHTCQGKWPTTSAQLQQLPGIGSYTAGAIATFCFGEKTAVVDGNIARVLSRLWDDPTPMDTPTGKKHFEALNHQWVQHSKHPALLQEGLIELGALVCKKANPLCMVCPVMQHCAARQNNTITLRPQRKPKLARTELHVVCAIVTHHQQVFLEKRPEKGLFGGLYEPPSTPIAPHETPTQAFSRLLQDRQLPPQKKQAGFTRVKRTLTHRDLHLYGFSVPAPHMPTPGGWFDLASLKKVGISKAIQVLLEAVLQ